VRSNGLPQVRVYDLEKKGSLDLVTLPEEVCAIHPGGNGDFYAKQFRLAYSSPISPERICNVDLPSRQIKLIKAKSFKNFDPTRFVCNRVMVKSHDGTSIPLTLVHKKDLKLTSTNPTMLLGYGAYGQPLEADFRVHHLPLLKRGWVIALAHVRGGGELGREWYRQGSRMEKCNTFYDFTSCAQYLVDKSYTSPSKLVARGTSAGGLLVGAALSLRPDLFRAVIMRVPFLNPIAAMTNESLPLTIHEYDEWGNPNADDEVYKYIKSYDPYMNLSPSHPEEIASGSRRRFNQYPSLLITTSTLDKRVPFWSPTKYVAKLRALQRAEAQAGTEDGNNVGQENIVLLKIDETTGHGGEGGRYSHLHEITFEYAFLFKCLGLLTSGKQ